MYTTIVYNRGMSRWEPDARGRLEQAALELYMRARVRTNHGGRDRRAGGTDRAHVLPALRRQARGAVRGRGRAAGAPRAARRQRADSAAPIDAVAAALEAAGTLLQERRDYAQQRQIVIAANAELRERELIKLASLAAALADALRQRGVERASRESDRRGRDRRLQGRVRTLDQRDQPAGLATTHPGVAGRTQNRDRGHLIIGGRSSAKPHPLDELVRRGRTGQQPRSLRMLLRSVC